MSARASQRRSRVVDAGTGPRRPAPQETQGVAEPLVRDGCGGVLAPMVRRGSQVVRRRSAKPLYIGSIPIRASIRMFHSRDRLSHRWAGVMELVYIGDLKSPARKGMWVRLPPPAALLVVGVEGRPDANQGVATSRSDDLLGRAGWPTAASRQASGGADSHPRQLFSSWGSKGFSGSPGVRTTQIRRAISSVG